MKLCKSGISAVVAIGGCLSLAYASHAAIVVTEVHPSGSGNSTYAADWFELTNTGGAAVSISGWKVDDSSNAAGSAVLLNNVSSIAPGQSAVFVEGDATTVTAFNTAWFGSSVPSGFAIGFYSGSGIGLSNGGDAINIFDNTNAAVSGANVAFSSATATRTFDNAAGLSGSISALSTVGVNGAFTSLTGGEIGSPGTIETQSVPEPASTTLLVLAGLAVSLVGGRRR